MAACTAAVVAVALAGTVSQPLAWSAAALGLVAVLVLALSQGPEGRAARASQAADAVRLPAPDGSAPGGLSASALAAAVPDPLIVFDRSGAVLHANPAAVAAFGPLPPGLSLPLRFRAPEMQALIDGAVATGRATAGDHAERVPLERVFRVSAVPLGSDGQLWALFFQDWSEARRTDRMRADFVANASHELRTPLASIAGFVETLKGPARDDVRAREKFLGIIGEQTARMARLIDDLLSLSRLETKPYLDLSQRVDLLAVAREVAAALAPLAAESGVRIDIAADGNDLWAAGHRDELFQVVENLVENACRYGASGKRVEVALARGAGGGTVLRVEDWGPGIAAEHLPRITERFYRADVQSSRARQGTGLGLAIVKHIATRHHARLAIRSAPGEGASFSLHFPPS